MVSFSKQYMINSLLDKHHSRKTISHHMTTFYLIPKQCLKIESSIVNTNNHLNKIFPVFDSLNRELSFSFGLMNTFPDYFFFYLAN